MKKSIDKTLARDESKESLENEMKMINNIDTTALNNNSIKASEEQSSNYDDSMFDPLIKENSVTFEDVDITTKVFGPLPAIHEKNCGFLPDLKDQKSRNYHTLGANTYTPMVNQSASSKILSMNNPTEHKLSRNHSAKKVSIDKQDDLDITNQ